VTICNTDQPSQRDQAVLEHARSWMTSVIAVYESRIDNDKYFQRDTGYYFAFESYDIGTMSKLAHEPKEWSWFQRVIDEYLASGTSPGREREWRIRVHRNMSVLVRAATPRPQIPGTCAHCGRTDARKFCKGCRKAVYCGHACAHAHWKAGHRSECHSA